MLQFFKKKTPFVDIWSGTPEMHCHVLPGIDDGAKNSQTSIILIEKYKELGCPHIIATPHTMHGIYDNTPSSIENAYTSIKDQIGSIKLSFSSEYMVDDNFETLLDNKSILPLYKNYVLIEMSYFQPPENIKDIIFKIGTLGYIPVLAHPERYAYYHNKIEVFQDFKARGCLLQLNALSLSEHYGDSCQKTALKLLKDEFYDFIGIDTHKIEHLTKIEHMKIGNSYVPALKKVCDKTSSLLTS
ncbi:capsular polysaccharide biosynthesis protein [Dokdonia pacifica]|uniref:protein-tyrosine-phosphatase n=1 Tax=Dokdonia pacifica TaxID=1627892 RepID=A0A238YLX8_9FLAO|nr:CpsB/CapC family capsule biosynthesis tyrosine phosphatase [Dokdonia pacifica]GGG11499.1 capsular polysaccharide biosynthesis protein [Dokdonia pacifica]SNR71808.1 protein-tyrosine phosphatase [Dokdonia pacifica]